MTQHTKKNRSLIGPLWLVGFFTFGLLMLYGSTRYRYGPIRFRNGGYFDKIGQRFSEADYRRFLSWELCLFGACAITLLIGVLPVRRKRVRRKRISVRANQNVVRTEENSTHLASPPGMFTRLLNAPLSAPHTTHIPVHLNFSTRLSHLVAILIVLALPIWLFLYGWFFQDAEALIWLTGFGVFVSGVTLVSVYKAKILRFDSAPALVIHPDGVEISPDKVLRWAVLRDAVVFTREGKRSIGLRLRQDLAQHERSEIEKQFAGSLNWQILGLPWAIELSAMSDPKKNLLMQFEKHGLRITTIEEDIGFGKESLLR